MKKTLSVLLMSAMGMVGTFAWAGSAPQDSVARLHSSVEVLHAIMATPDKGIPEEVLSNAKCILVVPEHDQRRIHLWRQTRTRRCYLPHCRRLERTGFRLNWRWELRDFRSASKASTWSCWS